MLSWGGYFSLSWQNYGGEKTVKSFIWEGESECVLLMYWSKHISGNITSINMVKCRRNICIRNTYIVVYISDRSRFLGIGSWTLQ